MEKFPRRNALNILNIRKNRNRSLLLLASELVFILTSAFWGAEEREAILLNAFNFIFFCAGGYSLANRKEWLFRYIGFALGALVFRIFEHIYLFPVLSAACVLGAHYLLFREILNHSFFKPNVPVADRILAGVCGYLLLGLFWSQQLDLLNVFQPGSVLNQITGETTNHADNLYFGFSTLTTLGYGDIIPIHPLAKVVSIFASLSGVLYLAVFISALMGGLHKR